MIWFWIAVWLVVVWQVGWLVVFSDNRGQRWLRVQYVYDEELFYVRLRFAPRLPRLLGRDYVTLGGSSGIIRTRLPDALNNPLHHLPILKHEVWHLHQQRRWGWWGFWLFWYLVNPRFRKKQEAEAAGMQWADWPVVELV